MSNPIAINQDNEHKKEFIEWFKSLDPYKGVIADHEGVIEGKSAALTPGKIELILQIFSEWEEKQKRIEALEAALRKCVLWAESISMRVEKNRSDINWRYLNEAREALAASAKGDE